MLAWLLVGEMLRVACFSSQESDKRVFSFRFCQLLKRKKWNRLNCVTCLVLILNVVGGDGAVSIESLRPAEIHAPIFHLSHLQLGGVGGLWGFKEREHREKREWRWRGERRNISAAYVNKWRSWHNTLCIYIGAVTLNGELDEASSFSVRVDGVTGKENWVLALGWL